MQITRLRLFIAITADRRNNPTNEPLPNLEARIVCADTLATVAEPDWRPDRTGQLADTVHELLTTLTATALENRALWFDGAHTEEDKQALLQRDSRPPKRFEGAAPAEAHRGQPSGVGPIRRIADLRCQPQKPSRADARLLFYENPWRGFDIVIGNPPYEALSKSVSDAGCKRLADEKRYKTTKVKDLYSLFCETALALAKPEGGMVTLVVPLSIAFGQQQETLRSLFENRCREIKLRHYDNIPDTIFNGSPVLKTWKNRQRATIMSVKLGADSPIISSSGLQGWLTSEREECLNQRSFTIVPKLRTNVDRRIRSQWLRAPTPEVAQMVEAIVAQ